MNIDALLNDKKVIKDLLALSKKHIGSGFVGFVGLKTDEHPCTLELKYEIFEQDGNPEICLMAYYKSDSTEVDEESSFLEKIADRITESIEEVSGSWSADAKATLEHVYGVCLLHNNKQIY